VVPPLFAKSQNACAYLDFTSRQCITAQPVYRYLDNNFLLSTRMCLHKLFLCLTRLRPLICLHKLLLRQTRLRPRMCLRPRPVHDIRSEANRKTENQTLLSAGDNALCLDFLPICTLHHSVLYLKSYNIIAPYFLFCNSLIFILRFFTDLYAFLYYFSHFFAFFVCIHTLNNFCSRIIV